MSFQPVLPLAGYAGWRFLQRTQEMQTRTFAESRPVANQTDYFRDNIAKVRSAEDLVGDRRLLEVALVAFGLGDDLDNKAFVQKILSDGTLDPDALSNKLSDKRYEAFARSFGFGDLGARTALSGFSDDIIDRYEARRFEIAVGEQDDLMRRALFVPTAVDEVVEQASSDTARWFAMMGNPPLRSVFEGALGFPASIAQIDLDMQLEQFQSRAATVFGVTSFEEFAAPEMQEKLIRMFMLKTEAANSAALSSNNIALTLLRGGS